MSDWELGLNLSDQKEVRTQQGYEGTWGFARFSGVLRSFVSVYVRSYEGAPQSTVADSRHLTGQRRTVF